MSYTHPNRYPIKNSKRSSHAVIRRYILELMPKRILDLGCGNGSLTGPIIAENIEVFGMESNSHDALLAEENGLIVSIQKLSDSSTFPQVQISLVVAADILEHLENCETFLLHLRNSINEDSKMIVSIPNVANIFIRIQLLFGRFTYTERGILDKTHLRFYTQKSLLNLFRATGYSPKVLDVTPIPLSEVLPNRFPRILVKYSEEILYILARIRPTLFSYQFILEVLPNPEKRF